MGLVMALRALPGDPIFVSTSSTVFLGSSLARAAPIALIFLVASAREVPGATRT